MTRIILIGAGRGGRALVELFHKDPSVEIIGVADKDEGAPGIVLARELGLPVATSYRKFLKADAADLIIDVTGDPDVGRDVYHLRPHGTEVVGGKTARFLSEFAGKKNQTESLQDQYQLALRELEARAEGEFIIGNNLKMKEISGLISKVAPTPTTVLVRGESGTGKELVARAIHAGSPRRFHPLVVIHCGALTETLLESELFGHEKGAFTGAQYRKKGKFEIAEGGTVFLDEIGDISLKTQTDLLRVLQEREITRVGGNQTIKVDFRVVAATNKDLEQLIEEGKFRPDLFYRLNVFHIEIPPLRERREDIPLLVDHFARKFSREMSKKITRVSPAAMNALQQYGWPGNVRELENAVERAMVVAQEPELREQDFVLKSRNGAALGDVRSLEDVERAHILRVLEESGGNQTHAAEVLGIDRVTLHHKLKKYGWARKEKEQAEAAASN